MQQLLQKSVNDVSPFTITVTMPLVVAVFLLLLYALKHSHHNHSYMNTVETHALIAHLPLTASVIGIFILLFGSMSRSYRMQMTGHLILVIASAGAFFAFLTGNDLEYNMNTIQGVSQSEVIRHTDFACYAIIVLGCLGILSLSALWLNLKESSLVKTINPVVIATALIGFAVIAFTGYLGVQIRNAEVKNNAAPAIAAPGAKKEAVVSFSGK